MKISKREGVGYSKLVALICVLLQGIRFLWSGKAMKENLNHLATESLYIHGANGLGQLVSGRVHLSTPLSVDLPSS